MRPRQLGSRPRALAHAAHRRVFWLIGVVTGPALGFALIFADLSLILINAIGALVFALLVPYIAIGRTLLYFDLQAAAARSPAKCWRERLPRRAATAEA